MPSAVEDGSLQRSSCSKEQGRSQGIWQILMWIGRRFLFCMHFPPRSHDVSCTYARLNMCYCCAIIYYEVVQCELDRQIRSIPQEAGLTE
jgi:hypothetical protein